MSPLRRQSSPDQPPEPPEEVFFPDLDLVETTLEQISKAQEKTTDAIKLGYDNLDKKIDRVESELRKEHTVIIERSNQIKESLAVLAALRSGQPPPAPSSAPAPAPATNITISSGNSSASASGGGDGGKPATDATGGFGLGITGNTVLKVALAVLLFAVSAWIVSSVGAKIVQLKSGDKEATIYFDDKAKKPEGAKKNAPADEK
jgi:hypothetical protein